MFIHVATRIITLPRTKYKCARNLDPSHLSSCSSPDGLKAPGLSCHAECDDEAHTPAAACSRPIRYVIGTQTSIPLGSQARFPSLLLHLSRIRPAFAAVALATEDSHCWCMYTKLDLDPGREGLEGACMLAGPEFVAEARLLVCCSIFASKGRTRPPRWLGVEASVQTCTEPGREGILRLLLRIAARAAS